MFETVLRWVPRVQNEPAAPGAGFSF